MEAYKKPFVINGAKSNNAFSFEQRQKAKGMPPVLHVADLRYIGYDELVDSDLGQIREGDETAFEDFDDSDKLVSCKGLQHFIGTELPFVEPVPAYIFDNHNHAFYFWIKHLELCQSRPVLIHFDQHKDTRMPESLPAGKPDLQTAFNYTNEVLNVGNFLGAAIKMDLFEEVFIIDAEDALANLTENVQLIKKIQQHPLFIDIDLDFFSHEMAYIEENLKIRVINKFVRQARLVTFATSPFFIDFGIAKQKLQMIFKSL